MSLGELIRVGYGRVQFYMNKLDCPGEWPAGEVYVFISCISPTPTLYWPLLPHLVFSPRHKDDERAGGMLPPDLIKTLPSCYDKHNECTHPFKILQLCWRIIISFSPH